MSTRTPNVTATSNIRAEMGRQRVTLRDLADRSGISIATLSRKLRDFSPLNLLELAQLAAALGVTAESLLTDDRDHRGVA